jgi:ATP-dependent Zn protease
MITKTTPSFFAQAAAFLALVACAALISAPAALAGPIAYQDESYAEFQQQLASGQIAAVTINKRLASLRTTLKDGRYVLAKYGHKEEPKVVAVLAAKHVPVTILTPVAAKLEVPKAVHHKLRYIAGGVLILLLVVVGAVLVMRSRRRPD